MGDGETARHGTGEGREYPHDFPANGWRPALIRTSGAPPSHAGGVMSSPTLHGMGQPPVWNLWMRPTKSPHERYDELVGRDRLRNGWSSLRVWRNVKRDTRALSYWLFSHLSLSLFHICHFNFLRLVIGWAGSSQSGDGRRKSWCVLILVGGLRWFLCSCRVLFLHALYLSVLYLYFGLNRFET
jgi:hypothetical protein